MSFDEWQSKVQNRIAELKTERKFYEFHQYFRTVLNKLKRRKEFSFGRDILNKAILYLLENKQYDSSIDLCSLLVEVYRLERKVILHEDVTVFIDILSKLKIQHENRNNLIQNISSLFEDSNHYEFFNLSLCKIYWNEGDFIRARYRVLLSNNGIAAGYFLIKYQTELGLVSEIDLFITQVVLQYLCLKKEILAAETFHTYVRNHPKIEMMPPSQNYPLLNFIWLMLICILNQEESQLFILLRKKYQPHLDRDLTFNQYLDEIGVKYFKLKPTSSSKKKSPLDNLFNLFGGFDEIFNGNDSEPSDECIKSSLYVDEVE